MRSWRPFDLERQLVGMSIGPAASILQAFQTAVLVAVEDLVAGHPGDAKLPAQRSHLLAIEQTGYKL